MNSEQFFEYEKKIESLTNQINLINSQVIDNSNMAEKVNNFHSFRAKAENLFFDINSKIYSIQKEYKSFVNKTEKTLNDSVRYPGLIGKDERFENFKKFIDYILSYFKEYDEFRSEINNFDIYSFKKRINLDLMDCKSEIKEGDKISLNMIQKNKRELDSILQDSLKQNEQILRENELLFKEFRNTIIEELSECQNDLRNVEKNINDKYNEQLKENEIWKNKFLEDMNNFKANFESKQMINQSVDENNELKCDSKFNGSKNNSIGNFDEIYDKLSLLESKKALLPLNLKNINYNKKGEIILFLKNYL